MSSIVETIQTFFKEVAQEARKVSWPTWQETKQSTMLVIVFSALVALILGFFDSIFRALLSKFFI
ncbi:MAG: preprotein translocase subunit SecE [Candidatus Wildermuthbacteria bacterium]|nr:preprotein translocase subunit SecE [Candidatus Wildermuthbacteria bacterium]MBI2648023.1 preprotein translocase subunit SecE [Candidatus Wildermuthbacteria bacterium]